MNKAKKEKAVVDDLVKMEDDYRKHLSEDSGVEQAWKMLQSSLITPQQMVSFLNKISTLEPMKVNIGLDVDVDCLGRRPIVLQNEKEVNLPTLSEVKKFIEENEELIGFDQNAKLFAINLYLWIKSR